MLKTKKAHQSKIQLSALIIIAVNLMGLWGVLSAELELKLVSTVNIVGPVMIIVFRQWFTNTRLSWK